MRTPQWCHERHRPYVIRDLTIYEEYKNGMRKCDLARKYALSPAMVDNLVHRWRQREEQELEWYVEAKGWLNNEYSKMGR